MSHSDIVSNVAIFDADVTAATGAGKEYVLGETNSGKIHLMLLSGNFRREAVLTRAVSGGGAATVSPTFGAALWTMDYVLQAATSNIKRSYFHHGTIGLCYYCWWGRYDSTYSLSFSSPRLFQQRRGGSTLNLSLLQNQEAFFRFYVKRRC